MPLSKYCLLRRAKASSAFWVSGKNDWIKGPPNFAMNQDMELTGTCTLTGLMYLHRLTPM